MATLNWTNAITRGCCTKHPNLTLGLGDDDHAKACFNRLAPRCGNACGWRAERDFPLSPEQPS